LMAEGRAEPSETVATRPPVRVPQRHTADPFGHSRGAAVTVVAIDAENTILAQVEVPATLRTT